MKRFISILMATLMLFCSVGCTYGDNNNLTSTTSYDYDLDYDFETLEVPEFDFEAIEIETTTEADEYNGITVYVSKSGKIHSISYCSGMKYYTEMSYDEAVDRGYDFCQNCY